MTVFGSSFCMLFFPLCFKTVMCTLQKCDKIFAKLLFVYMDFSRTVGETRSFPGQKKNGVSLSFSLPLSTSRITARTLLSPVHIDQHRLMTDHSLAVTPRRTCRNVKRHFMRFTAKSERTAAAIGQKCLGSHTGQIQHRVIVQFDNQYCDVLPTSASGYRGDGKTNPRLERLANSRDRLRR